MKTTLNWLRELLDIPIGGPTDDHFEPEWLAERLTQAGLEVDSIQPLAKDVGTVVAEVTDLWPHPDSDHLKVCQVKSGGGSQRIVCGAPNVGRGQKVALAPVGTMLPSGLEIQPRSIRGEPSEGMLCSEQELDLSDDHAGIMVLPKDAPVGASLHGYLGLNDSVIEIGVTPNRGDCLSALGLAREVAAFTGDRLRRPRVVTARLDTPEAFPIRIQISAPERCSRYSARLIDQLEPAAAPLWLRIRLRACGIRPINRIVDVTNYVMLETGQPLHAFDAGRIGGQRIVVRLAEDTRQLTTLDGVARALVPDDLLICDGDAPVALAGIMGGRDSEVTDSTRSVLLESAHFDPLTIRRTAKRLGLHTEASHRFERGVDPQMTRYALDRAVALWRGMTRAKPLPNAVDVYPRPWQPTAITLRSGTVKRALGVTIPQADVRKILGALEIRTHKAPRQDIRIEPPSFRFDLSREADIVEEIARVYGYDRIPESRPMVRAGAAAADATLHWTRRIKTVLVGEGLTELVTLPFTAEEMNERFAGLWPKGVRPVPVINPLRQDTAWMRLSLLPALIENARGRIAQQSDTAMIFEINKVFARAVDDSFTEAVNLAGLLLGHRPRSGVGVNNEPFTFASLKGIMEQILAGLGIEDVDWDATHPVFFLHPGKCAHIVHRDTTLGILGELHPASREEWDVPAMYLFELDFGKTLHYARADFKVRPLPRFPLVERDLAIVVAEDFASQRVVDWVRGLHQELINEVVVFDEYRGAPISVGEKSLAFKVLYRAPDRTLTDEEVNSIHQNLTQQLCRDIQATLRQ